MVTHDSIRLIDVINASRRATDTSFLMPRWALGVLKNLGNWAKANTKKTILGKLKKGGKHDKSMQKGQMAKIFMGQMENY
jgi:hypothetical protein